MKVTRRDFVRSGAYLSSLLGFNPATVLQEAAAALPAEKFGTLLSLEDSLSNYNRSFSGGFLAYFNVGKEAPRDAGAIVDDLLERDDEGFMTGIVEAFVHSEAHRESYGEIIGEINRQVRGLLEGKEDFAVQLRSLSSEVSAAVRQRFIEDRLEEIASMDKGNPSRAEAEKLLGQFQSECPYLCSIDELNKHVNRIFPPIVAEAKIAMAMSALFSDGPDGRRKTTSASRAHLFSRVDGIVSGTSLAMLPPGPREKLTGCLRGSRFWLGDNGQRMAEMSRMLSYSNIDYSLNSAFDKAVEGGLLSKEKRDKIRQRMTTDGLWNAEFKMKLFGGMAQSELLSPALRTTFRKGSEGYRDILASIHRIRGKGAEDAPDFQEAQPEPEEAAIWKEAFGISEDTLKVHDAIRRPGEYGREHDWREALGHDRNATKPREK